MTIVGSAGTYPVAGRPASGYVVEDRGIRVWLEAGPGTFTALPFDSSLIDAVVISHQHPDHCLDLLTAFHAFRYGPDPRSGVPVYSPKSVADKLLSFVDDHEDGAMAETFLFNAVSAGDEVTIGGITIHFRTSDHSVPTVASRWEANGKVFAYTGDTGPLGDWMAVAEGADLFLSEASYQGESGLQPYPHHLTATEAGRIARNVGAKHLMLTHIPPYLDSSKSVAEAEAVFDRPVELAVPGVVRKV
ncbi:MAG: MBL fold metallo-hydrolase [Acidimicrobiia bacterium]